MVGIHHWRTEVAAAPAGMHTADRNIVGMSTAGMSTAGMSIHLLRSHCRCNAGESEDHCGRGPQQ